MPPRKPKKPSMRIVKAPAKGKRTISNEEFQRARRKKAIESAPSPELVAAQHRAIAEMTKQERTIFDGVVHQIKSLHTETPPQIVMQIMQESTHWALPPLVKVYLVREFSQKISGINW